MRSAIILAALLAASPALAWTNTNNGNHNQIVDGGPGAQSNAASRATAKAASDAAARVQANQRLQANQQTRATGGPSNAAVHVTNMPGAGGVYPSDFGRSAPDVYLPSIGGGGMDCPTVGFGAAGSALGGGGGFGPSWISSKCDKRKTADLLSHLYGPDVARAYAYQNIDGVKEAVDASHAASVQDYPPDWCYTVGVGDGQHRECVKK